METSSKSALITGGASGMGFAVAEALANRGGWNIHLVDLNAERGHQAAKAINATFHQVDITDYNGLASTFQRIYDLEHNISFVFANAGIVEQFNFYESHPPGSPPPPPDHTVLDINLKSVVNTAWLALHYMRQSGKGTDKNIIFTASSGAFYPADVLPCYCASKHGVLGFMRSIASPFYAHDGIRCNAICPGPVRTNLLDTATWNTFFKDTFVPIERITDTCLTILDGCPVGGEGGGERNGEKMVGEAIELSALGHYYREAPDFCDESMRRALGNKMKDPQAQ